MVEIEWAKIILQAVQALVWPITVLVILLMFKRQISGRLSSLTKAELPGGLKFELSELKDAVDKSPELTKRSIPASLLSPSAEPSRADDPLLAVISTRLEVEREIVRLAQISLGHRKAGKFDIPLLVSQLSEKQVLSKETLNKLFEYIRVTNKIIHSAGIGVDDIGKSLSIGTSLLAHIRYVRGVEQLLRDFDGNLLWHWREKDGSNRKFHFWSAIADSLPEYDYSYEAFQEAAAKFNGQRANDKFVEIYIPPSHEFIKVLEFRRGELERILQGKWWDGYEWENLKEWQWPQEWGKITWTGPIVESANEAEVELFRTERAIERYSQQVLSARD
jgi:hypothetical protein